MDQLVKCYISAMKNVVNSTLAYQLVGLGPMSRGRRSSVEFRATHPIKLNSGQWFRVSFDFAWYRSTSAQEPSLMSPERPEVSI